MTQLRDYAKRNLITAPATATAAQVSQTMKTYNIGAVVVTKDNAVVGLVTEREVCRSIVADGLEASSPIEDLIETQVPRLSMDATITQASDTMRKSEIRYVFVMDDDSDEVIGMISMQDVIRALAQALKEEADALKKYIAGERHA